MSQNFRYITEPRFAASLGKLAAEIDKAKAALAKTSVIVHFRKKPPTK